MKRRFGYIGWVLFLGMPMTAAPQEPGAQRQIEAIVESVIENLQEDADASIVLEDLEGFVLNPLNINSASHEQLSRLHLLNTIQIEKLIEYREKYGPILSIYELNTVKELYPEVLERMLPFIWFGPREEEPVTFREMINYGRHEILLRSLGTLQKARGYIQTEDGTMPYEGDRFRYYNRYRFQSGDNISAGVLAEKDPGEAFFAGANSNGFDFYSGHLSFKITPFIPSLTVGDFMVRSGQGLVIWQGFSMGKSFYTLNLAKTNPGIRPYTSTDENQFFRGVAASLNKGNYQFSFFVSKKKRDGNLAYSDSLGNFFTSLQSSGYHRTESEIADKNSISDFNSGVLGHWQKSNLKLGAVFLYRQFGLSFLPADQLYNRFNFRGTENYTAGVDYLYSKGRYQLFGEAAVSKSGAKAYLQGVTAYLHDQLQFSALFRHFDKDYHALWSAPLAEGSSAINETGLFTGIRILPVKYVIFSAYGDLYRSSWIKYSTAGPSDGYDIFAQADFNPPGPFQFYLRYKNEVKDRKFRLNEIHVNQPVQVDKSRLHMEFHPSGKVSLRTRFEFVYYKGKEAETGTMIYQDVQFAPEKVPLNLSVRVAWFDTEGYNSRIYAYENDLLYTFAIPAYFGKGIRAYFNLKYKLGERTEIWLKLADTLQNDVESIGTGYNQIAGNQKTELKFQLRVKL